MHAVSRSSEFLSSAKTAVKVARSRHANETYDEPQWWSIDPGQLQLAPNQPAANTVVSLCEDGLSLLRGMQVTLTKLQGLVRRRGHTNDPTQEIALCTKQLETDAKELATTVTTLKAIPSRYPQQKKHLELVAAWLQRVASQQSEKLKEILKVRGDVLADQAQRRKLLNPHAQAGSSSSSAAPTGSSAQHRANGSNSSPSRPGASMSMMNSPLFTATQGSGALSAATSQRPQARVSNGAAKPLMNGNGASQQNQRTPFSASSSSYYGGYGGSGGYGGVGGGGYGGISSTSGMRQRRGGGGTNGSSASPVDDAVQMQSQIQERRVRRQTQNRLDSAQQAESTLAELGTVFGKMSTLISQQGEVLEKVEDDVEAAMVDVTAGQDEIQVLYTMKKGNRGLIIKTFAILIFFIIFMRFY